MSNIHIEPIPLEKNIPFNVFQTWPTKNLPSNMKENFIKTKQNNREFNFFLYDDIDCRNFIKNNFNNTILYCYDKLKPGAFKSDLWRLCILYLKGGIYMDIKLECCDNFHLNQLTDSEYFVRDLKNSDKPYLGIFNAFMVCKRGNIFIKQCIITLCNNVLKSYYGEHALDPTGPLFMMKVNLDNNFNIPIKLDHIKTENSVEYHNRFICLNNKPIIKCGYKGYKHDREKNKNYHYAKMWKNKDIYNKMDKPNKTILTPIKNKESSNPTHKIKLKISVCLCVRNGEKYINHIHNLFGNIERIYKNYVFEYFVYENNSTDNTKNAIKIFFQKGRRKGKFLLENLENNKMKSGINIERGNHMAKLRNKLKDYHGKLNSDYVLLLDCDVIFLPKIIRQFINTLNKNTAMVTPYGMCYNVKKRHNDLQHYYDSLAFISNDNISYKQNSNTCLFKECERCTNLRRVYKVGLDSKFLLDNKKHIIPVKSAFGSMAMIKTDVYNKVRWGNSICEHHSFCDKISKYGKIVVNTRIKTFVTTPNLPEYENMRDILVKLD